jgi:hypothetical protein
MTYSIPWDVSTNALSTTIIVRDSDGATIPVDPANADYQAYLLWLQFDNHPGQGNAPAVDNSALIADSARSLALAKIKALAAQGDTQAALAALMEITT